MSWTIVGQSPATKDVHLTGRIEVQVDSEADLSDITTDAPVGSVAYTADLSFSWVKKNDGTWVRTRFCRE